MLKQFLSIMSRYLRPYRKYLAWSVVLNFVSQWLNVFSFVLICRGSPAFFSAKALPHPEGFSLRGEALSASVRPELAAAAKARASLPAHGGKGRLLGLRQWHSALRRAAVPAPGGGSALPSTATVWRGDRAKALDPLPD